MDGGEEGTRASLEGTYPPPPSTLPTPPLPLRSSSLLSSSLPKQSPSTHGFGFGWMEMVFSLSLSLSFSLHSSLCFSALLFFPFFFFCCCPYQFLILVTDTVLFNRNCSADVAKKRREDLDCLPRNMTRCISLSAENHSQKMCCVDWLDAIENGLYVNFSYIAFKGWWTSVGMMNVAQKWLFSAWFLK